MPSFHVNAKHARLDELLPGVYISGVTALRVEQLRPLELQCVINCTQEVPNLHWLAPHVERVKLWLDDTDQTQIAPFLHMVSDRIEFTCHSGDHVLVHCVAGVSRSAAFCLAYLLKYQCRSLREAFHWLAAKRPLVRPNLGFWRQLIEFEIELKGKASVRIVQAAGLLDCQAIPDVYMSTVVSGGTTDSEMDKENQWHPMVRDGRERRGSGAKPKFVPILDPLPEMEP